MAPLAGAPDAGGPLPGHCFAIVPPYRTFPPLPASRLPDALPEGAVLALRVSTLIHDFSSIPGAVRKLRARFRTAPVVLWVPGDPNPEMLHLAYGAARL